MKNKERILEIYDFLRKKTNKDHLANANSIIEHLEKEGYEIERKTVYSDINALIDMGYDIEKSKKGYYFTGDVFSAAELRILLDLIKGSNFLSQKKSQEISYRLCQQINCYDRDLIENGSFVSTKSVNDEIFENVTKIIEAIDKKVTIKFNYFDLYVDNKKVYRDKKYELCPYSLVVDDNRYYLIGFNEKHGSLSTYRVDKMDSIKITNKEFEKGKYDLDRYINEKTKMYGGEKKDLRLRVQNSLYSEVIMNFGNDIMITKKEKDYFECSVQANLSHTFYSWVFTFAGKIQIIGPEDVRRDFVNECQQMMELYK